MKKIIYVACLILLNFSCTTDDFQEPINSSNENNKFKVKMKTVNLSEISKSDSKSFTKMEEFSKNLELQQIVYKNNFDNLHEMVAIDTTHIIQVDINEKSTYTLKLEEQNNMLFNLVLFENEHDEYQWMLAKYDASPMYSSNNYQLLDIDEELLLNSFENLNALFNTENASNTSNEQICPPGFCCETGTITSEGTGWETTVIISVYVCDEDTQELEDEGVGGPGIPDNNDNSNEDGQDDAAGPGSFPGASGEVEGGINFGTGSDVVNPGDNQDGFDPDTDINRIRVITTPNLGGGNSFNTFYSQFSPSLLFFWNSLNSEQKSEIQNFLSASEYSEESMDFALELLVIMVENPNFNPDFELSYKSPYNIDLTQVTPSETNPEPEKERFMEIYNAVTTSSMFKNLIQQTFDESERLNVTFEIVNSLPSASGSKANGKAVLNMGTLNQTEGNEHLDITIQINKERLIGAYATSKITIARTIMHEYIHAYLYVKLVNANLGATLEDLNNNDLAESLNEYNLALNNDNLQAQHEFMFDKMVPTISSNLAQILNILVPANHRTGAEGTVFNYTVNNIKDPRNESNVVSITLPGNPWSWNDFYYYFSLEGLQNTDAFYNTIWLSENHVLYGLYREYLNVGNNLFN